GHSLSEEDLNTIRAHNFRVEVDQGAREYNKMRHAFPALSSLDSLHQMQTRIAFLSGIKPINYDCCINSCCCFTAAYWELHECPFCGHDQFDSRGRPHNTFSYLPLILRLVNMFLDPSTCEKLNYRTQRETTPGTVEDVFDSEHYAHLKKTRVIIGDEILNHKFFEFPSDLAMGISTDGFGVFKRR
ncbi:hypothetical protein F5878DRAFT_515342, partial [Lentinula raphanica]